MLIFATGPLTASGAQTSNRFTVSTKSPLTGTVLDSNSGGYWGMQFKKAGYDVLIVRGASHVGCGLSAPPTSNIDTPGLSSDCDP